MSKQIFREKSMNRISSPEQLNEYIRVASPSVWVILIAVLFLLTGACVWGVFGHLDTKVPAVLTGKDARMYVYLPEENIQKVESGMTVLAGEAEYIVDEVASVPLKAAEVLDDYGLHVSGFSPDAWVYQIAISGDYAEGIMPAEVIVESIAPMTFLFN